MHIPTLGSQKKKKSIYFSVSIFLQCNPLNVVIKHLRQGCVIEAEHFTNELKFKAVHLNSKPHWKLKIVKSLQASFFCIVFFLNPNISTSAQPVYQSALQSRTTFFVDRALEVD